MLRPGQQLELDIDKPAAGGRMIARHEGQVVFVSGTIPGERVLARIERVERQLAFAATIELRQASPDRREAAADPLCGGCSYSHIAYPRQLSLKADLVRDAFARLGRIELPDVPVVPSPERGYRMRGRLYVQDDRIGFYREGSHTLCDAAATGLLTGDAVAIAASCAAWFRERATPARFIEVSENLAGNERAVHAELEAGARVDAGMLRPLWQSQGLTGCSVRSDRGLVEAGDPAVSDPLAVLTRGRAGTGALRRRPSSFFQANRFLLPDLVATVLDAVPAAGDVLELYAGVGLFAVALAGCGHRGVTAVEGDPSSGADLVDNARQFPDAVRVVRGSVEGFLAGGGTGGRAQTVILDPPRTGLSRRAMTAVAGYGAAHIVYVSCDPATMARDARRLLDAGYALTSLAVLDLFPTTPHVESVAVFARGTGTLGGQVP